MDGTLSLYVGCPGSGKTYRAMREAVAVAARHSLPVVLVDSQGMVDHPGFTLCKSVREVIVGSLDRGEHTRVVPESIVQVEQVVSACWAWGNVVVVLDEIGLWATAHSTPQQLAKCIRTYRMRKLHIHATTQYVGDVAPVVRQCASSVWAFRTEQSRALSILKDEYGFEPEELRQLSLGEFRRWTRELKKNPEKP